MGSDGIDDHFQTKDEPGAVEEKTAPLSYKEFFDELCPQYMAIGMSRDEFWHGEARLVIDYRKAWKIKQKQKNYELWFQGMYFYEALLDASPMFRFSLKPPKPTPYSDEPYALTKKEREEQTERKEKAEMLKIKASMTAWMKQIKGGEKGGSRN